MLVLSRDLDISMIFLLQRNQSDESPSAMDTECTLDKRPVDLEEENSLSDFKKATHTHTHTHTHTTKDMGRHFT